MATYPAATALELLSAAVALEAKPTLALDQVNLLMLIALAGESDYTSAHLDRAAAVGWIWKSGLTADQYEIGGGPGRTLKRSQWHDHCVAMADLYSTGRASVDGSTLISESSGIGEVTTVFSPFLTGWSCEEWT